MRCWPVIFLLLSLFSWWCCCVTPDNSTKRSPARHNREWTLSTRSNLKKLLRRKRRQLKRLAQEIDILRRRLNAKDSKDVNNGTAAADRWFKKRFCKKTKPTVEDRIWKKKVDSELLSIRGKLSKISNVLWHRTRSTDSKPTKKEAPRPSPAPPDPRPTRLMTFQISRFGNMGSTCSGHRHCKPGLCCHYNVTVGNTPAITGLCVQHALKEGQKCFDSCQCELGLNCFRNRLDKNPLSILDQKSEVSMPAVLINKVNPKLTGQCKVATTDDVLRGEYINGKEPVFYGTLN
ncbi:hypothetical protein T07_13543 [Trichinella nelsoni]|uniref:Uncharacterized protein n=1 Tax=Trichinella nelsoni TaxID=6336 RepID=A0A0V0RKF7_9BILA|nr:hypothetical protein T07_13543 [Trichinella nelsoni]